MQHYRKSFCDWRSCAFAGPFQDCGRLALLLFKILKQPYAARNLSYWWVVRSI